MDLRATKYSDVCATLDELKRVFAETPERIAEDPEAVADLFEDIPYMLARMHLRLEEYQRFAEGLAAVAGQMKGVPDEDLAGAQEKLAMLQEMLGRDPASPRTALGQLNALAEQVRDVANHQEQLLRDHKALWIRVWQLYQQVKGYRNWSEDEQTAQER